MRVAIARIPFSGQSQSVAVTCSFGVAEASGTYDYLIVERADQALYQSKQHGRNCVSIARVPSIHRVAAA
jgi:PleD family two-component response regulator